MAYQKQGGLLRVGLVLVLTSLLAACSLIAPSEQNTTTISGAPIVRIAAPISGDSYQEGVGIPILVRVENAGADIARVAIQVDGQIIGEALEPNPDGAASFTVRNGWVAAGAGQHTIAARVSRLDGTIGEASVVTVNVIGAAGQNPTTTTGSENVVVPVVPTTSDSTNNVQPVIPVLPTSNQQEQAIPPTATNTLPPPVIVPTHTPAPTNTTAPTATFTPSRPQVTVSQGANVRSGPDTIFPTVGSLASGAQANLLARNPSSTWYKIQYYNGEAWIFAQLVQVQGDVATLPVDAGPPTPIPASPTPQPTATPNTSVDLIISNATTSPFPFVCNRASEIVVTVKNNGTTRSAGTKVRVEDLKGGQVVATTEGPVPELEPGGSANVVMYLTVNVFVGEGHVSRVRIDPDNLVPETNENNNMDEDPYVLASC